MADDIPELILTPKQAAISGEVRVTEYPFVVGRQEPMFRELATSGPEAKLAIGKMSRKHATITYEAGEFKVTDLGSLNGSYFGGQRLGKNESATFTQGEEIGFSEWLTFKVEIVGGDVPTLEGPAVDPAVHETSPQMQGIKPIEAEDMTDNHSVPEGATMVLGQAQRANSVFNLLVQNKQKNDESEKAPDKVTAEQIHKQRRKNKDGASLWKEFGGTKIVITVLVVSGVIGLAIWNAMTGPEATTKRLLAKGEYKEALAVADVALAKADNDELERLVMKALIKQHLVDKGILSCIRRGEYDTAETLILAVEKASPNSRAAKDLSHYLRFAIRMIQGGDRIKEAGKIVAYKDEKIIRELLDEWKNNEDAFQHVMLRIQKGVDKDVDIGPTVNNHRASFRNYEDTLVKALNALKKTTERKLGEAKPKELIEAYKRFEQTYCSENLAVKVDISPLKEDLRVLQDAWSAIAERKIDKLAYLIEDDFHTPPFREQYTARMKDMPPREVMDAYVKSRECWKSGKMKDAITILSGLKTKKEWGEVVGQLKAKYEDKERAFNRYSNTAPPTDLKEQREILKARREYFSDPDDKFYRDKLQSLFQSVLKSAHSQADALWAAAQHHWKDYVSKGKIIQKHRLANTIDSDYIALAGALKESISNARKWKETQELLGNMPADRMKTYEEMIKECKFQYKRMDEAKIIVAADIVTAKLKLLPSPMEGDTD